MSNDSANPGPGNPDLITKLNQVLAQACEDQLEHFLGPVLYLEVNRDGVWARSSFPNPFLTIDWDQEDRIIGIEAVGAISKDLRDSVQQKRLSPALIGKLGAQAE